VMHKSILLLKERDDEAEQMIKVSTPKSNTCFG
jgi:hypothetical protein